jgi:hypothetical protein
MKLWLDDVRDPKNYHHEDGWYWVYTAPAAIAILKTGIVTEVSLDHDLGLTSVEGCGYDVAKYIEEAAYFGEIKRLKWSVHSKNPIGKWRMEVALRNADKYWDRA